MPAAKLRSGTKKLTSNQRQYRSDFPTGFLKPQLCELVKSPPVGENWVHEAKLDGYRMQMHVRSGRSTFYSRKGLDWTHRFPEIARVTDAFQSDGYNIAASPDYADALVQVKITTAQYFIQPTIAGGGCTPYAQFDVTMKSKAGKTLLDRTYRLQSGGGVGMTGHVLLPSDPKYDLADCNQISTQPQVPVAAFRAALALLKSAIAADVKKAS